MGPPLQRMTCAEFLAWEEQQPDGHEFYGGEIFAMVGGTARHNRVILNLASRIADPLDGTPCQVFAEHMKVQLADGVLYPDVMVTCGQPEAGDEQAISDPKLIIEVLSPQHHGIRQAGQVHPVPDPGIPAGVRADRPGEASGRGLHAG